MNAATVLSQNGFGLINEESQKENSGAASLPRHPLQDRMCVTLVGNLDMKRVLLGLLNNIPAGNSFWECPQALPSHYAESAIESSLRPHFISPGENQVPSMKSFRTLRHRNRDAA